MPTISQKVDFEVYCENCGDGLCNATKVTDDHAITVKLCRIRDW